MSDSGDRAALVRELLTASQSVLLGRIDMLDSAALALLTSGRPDGATQLATIRTAHQLVSLSAFGVARGGELAMRAEALLRADGDPGEQGAELAELSAGIRAALTRALTAAPESPGQPATGSPATAGASAPDVLVVEDDAVLVELLVRALEGAGYAVATAADGPSAVAAIDVAAGHRPRLVLLDIDLPALDGFGVLRTLSQRGVIPGVDVLCLTARASEPDVVAVLALGAIDHVAKPFSLPVLMARVARALG